MLVQNIDVENATNATAPVRVAVCGEVSAGKSTVLNALLRARVLPDNIGHTVRPVVTVGHREETGVEAIDLEGEARSAELNGGTKIFHDAAEVRLWTDHEHLAGLEIIEVPLTKAEELTEEQIELICSADVMVWVTIASQAWRLTEKTIVEKLGSARPKHAILAVTRGDKLRNDRDRGRLKERMVRETEHLFQECIFIKGARRKLDKSAKCDKAWDETGGAELMAALEIMAELVRSSPRVEQEPEAAEEAEVLAEHASEEPSEQTEEIAEEQTEEPAAEDQPDAAEATADDSEDDSDVVDFASFRHAAAPGRAAQAPAAKPEPEAATPPATDTPGIMSEMTSTLAGVIVLGLRPLDAPEDVQVTHGDEEVARELGSLCAQLQQTLAGTLAETGAEGGVSAFNLSTQGRRILFNDVPGVGLLFLMVEASEMSQGSAQSFLARVCRRLEEAA